MPGTFFGFNTALRGMQAQQRGIYTTSHNIANANTDGYTRQRVVLAPTPAYPVPGMNHPGGTGWQIGTGVDSQETTRLRDAFLDTQIRRETGSLGQWQQIQDVLQQVEVVFNEPSDTGLSTLFSQFWASWHELSKNAESSPVRTTVVETANALAEAFNHSYQQLTTIKNDIAGENGLIALRVTDINSIAQQISDLNGQIKNIIAAGDQPNDLMDQRDLLLDRLSKIIDFQVEPNIITVNGKEVSDGQIKVKLGSSTNYLVEVDSNQSKINEIKSVNEKIYMESDASNSSEIKFKSGEIKGLQDAISDVDTYLNKLNTLARGLAENINSIHKEGYNLSGKKVDSDTNNVDKYENFFVAFTDPSDPNKNITADNITAGNIAVNSNIRNDVSQIAAAYPDPQDTSISNPPASIAPGNGYNALRIAQLQQKLYDENNGTLQESTSGGVTIDDYYKNFTAKLGVDAHEATRMTTNQGVLVDQLTNRKESISGVSLDEEMANMLQYQRAYEASARMITTLDSMLDKIINGMGVTR